MERLGEEPRVLTIGDCDRDVVKITPNIALSARDAGEKLPIAR
jgi:hypothetical protein